MRSAEPRSKSESALHITVAACATTHDQRVDYRAIDVGSLEWVTGANAARLTTHGMRDSLPAAAATARH